MAERLHCLQVADPRPGPVCLESRAWQACGRQGTGQLCSSGAQQRHPWGHQPQASPQHFPRRPSDGRTRGQCLFPSLLSGLSAPRSDLCRGHDIPEQGGRSGKSRGSEGGYSGRVPRCPCCVLLEEAWDRCVALDQPPLRSFPDAQRLSGRAGSAGHSGCPWPGRARRGRG